MSTKRKAEISDEDSSKKEKTEESVESEEAEDVGPSLDDAVSSKPSKKVLEYEHLYLENLPSSEAYERSYMHRDTITHLVVIQKTDFIITASIDGAIKFWKKAAFGIEFVKHFRAHLGNIQDVSVNSSGTLFCTISNDKSVKIFDVVNFDMINMMKLDYTPGRCQWVHTGSDPVPILAVSDADSSVIRIYDGKGTSEALHTIEKLHGVPVLVMRYNPVHKVVISVDRNGMLEYWAPDDDYKFPEAKVDFDSKLDTDLYEFVKVKAVVHDIEFSENGTLFAVISNDRKVRLFKFVTGKIIRVFDEDLQHFTSLQQMKQLLPNMEFGRRMAMERELEKSEAFALQTIKFDHSGYFIIYPTMLGVKIVNWYTNRCVKLLGKTENFRPLNVGIYQGAANKPKASISVEMQAADNPALEKVQSDPSAFCTAFKKNRFFIFSRRNPEDAANENEVYDRDVFNEQPSREDIISATEAPQQQRIFENCVIHTTMGDIHCKLFAKECPKTVENFCVHAKNHYFNGHIFHRVIKQFMIQTGDPTGTGTGGESIWGGEFEDEFHPNLKHDKPYTLSMANAGPNTNGSQFFITVIPTPWLDNKHTVFGRVVKGMETVQNISNVKTNRKTDKPHDEIKIINVALR